MGFKYDAIVFDFDGVLAESVDVKGRAFYDLYEDAGKDVQESVLAHHLSHGGISRFDKIRHYEKFFLHRDPSDEDIQARAGKFSELVEEKVVASEWVKGTKEFLESHHDKLPLFVASATPQEELERIIDKRNMTAYFKGVYGSPTKKVEHLKTILKQNEWFPNRIVMIGDTMSDYHAAHEAGTAFIGRHIEGGADQFPEGAVLINDISELAGLIKI